MSAKDTKLSPIIKWAGGKESELQIIHENAPDIFNNYYEPFVGGGSVFMSFNTNKAFINDKSSELINLYHCISNKNESFFDWTEKICSSWNHLLNFARQHSEICEIYRDYREDKLSDSQLKNTAKDFLAKNNAALQDVLSSDFVWHRDIYQKELEKNISRKLVRMKKVEKERHIMPNSDIFDNVETAFMSSMYMYFRCLYNDSELMSSDIGFTTSIFFFIRNYAYSGMFRYNAEGKFNVPYGGIGYNHKLLDKKIEYYKSELLINHFSNASIQNQDFQDFFEKNKPTENDFVFLDPPYDTEFSTYAKNEFSKADQTRLANYLLNDCKAKWMMVIKNTPFIYSLYANHNLHISSFDKNYRVSFMNRNDKNVEHLLIRNY